MQNIRKNYIEKIEKLTGREITYSSIRPSLFGSIDIRNLKILYKNSDNFPEEFISISRLKFSFSLLKLLSGKKSAIKTVLIDHPIIYLDSKRDADIFRRLSSTASDNKNTDTLKNIARYFPKEPELVIRGGSLRLNDDGFIYQIQMLDIGVSGNGNEIALNGKFNAHFYSSAIFNRTAGARFAANFKGGCLPNLENAWAQIKLEAPQNNELSELSTVLEIASEKSINIGLNLNGGNLSLHTLGENLPYDWGLDYQIDTGCMDMTVSCSQFTPRELIEFKGELREANQLLAQTVTGKASFNYIDKEEFNYNIDFNGIEPLALQDSISIHLNGNNKKLNIDNFKIAASSLKTSGGLFQGNLSMDGIIDFSGVSARGNVFFENFSLSGLSNLNAVFRISSAKNEILALSDTVSFSQTELSGFNLKFYPSADNLDITLSAVCDDGLINMDSTFNRSPNHFETSLEFDSFSIMSITKIIKPFVRGFNIPEAADYYLGKTFVNAEIFFSTDFKKIIYNAPDINITFSGNTKNNTRMRFSLSGTDKLFNLNEGLISRNDKEFRVSSRIDFSNPNDFLFSLNANYLDTFWQIEGQALDKSSFMIRSSNGLQGYGNKSPSGAVSGYIEAVNFPLLINETIANLDFFISLRFENSGIWSLDIAKLECRNFFQKSDKSLLRLSGNADQRGARINDVFYSDKLSSLYGSVYSLWSSDFSKISLYLNLNEVLTANSQKTNESYILEGEFENNHMELSASVNGMRFDRFLNGNIYALLDADMKVSWDSISSFQADIDLSSLYLKTQNNIIQTSAAMQLNNDDLLIYNVNINYSGLIANIGEFFISRVENTVSAYAVLDGSLFSKKLDSRFTLNARFIPIDSWYQISKAINTFEGVINVENLIYGDTFSQEPFIISVNRNYIEFSIFGGPKNMFALEVDNKGDFFANISSPSPLRASITGRLNDNFIDARLNDFYLDLQALWNLAPPIPIIKLTGGYVTGNLDICGSVSNPLFSGGAKGSSVKFLIPQYLSQEIKSIPFDINIENNEISFGPVLSKSGSGSAAISANIGIQQWLPYNLALYITVPRESPIPFQFNIVNFISNGDTSGKMNINFDSSGLDIKGSLLVNNTEMSLANDDALSVRTSRENYINSKIPITVNITITTGSAVEFLWPNNKFPILTANPELGTVFNVNADTDAGQYNLTGDIRIRSGEIYYFERNFYIRHGTLVFRENEREFNPRLSALAEIRDRTDSGPVTISMIIDNQPLLKFMPRFEASPALTQLEIYSLLGQNSIQVMEDPEMAQRFFVNSTADILSQLIRIRLLERQIRNFLHMDMFSFRTQILQNVALTATGLGQPLVDTNYSFGNYLDNTTIFGGKYIGQDMFIQGMFALKYDRNTPEFYGLRAEPDIGIELQSPLFNIRWNLLGSWNYGLEIENSISLTWNFIY